MRCAVIADVHGNLEAFAAVLGDIEHQGGVEEVWCLGDIVGYGPDPHGCIELLRRCRHVAVAGNHDRAAIGKLDSHLFNPHARTAVAWTAAHLTDDDVRYLESLPLKRDTGDIMLVHGSPVDPLLEYVISSGIAARSFAFLESPFCLVGHSHLPAVFVEEEGSCHPRAFSPGIGVVLGKSRMIINPGAVGQPRDGDPCAAYAVYESESRIIRPFRIPYDFETTQEKIIKSGLPVQLAARLEEGR